MNCPRCGGSVTVYRLGEQESYVCGDCEYVGIDVEHGAEPEEMESWDEAMARFRTRFGDPEDADGVDVGDADVEIGADDGEAGDASGSSGGRQDVDSLRMSSTDAEDAGADGTGANETGANEADGADADDRGDLESAVVRRRGDGDGDA